MSSSSRRPGKGAWFGTGGGGGKPWVLDENLLVDPHAMAFLASGDANGARYDTHVILTKYRVVLRLDYCYWEQSAGDGRLSSLESSFPPPRTKTEEAVLGARGRARAPARPPQIFAGKFK